MNALDPKLRRNLETAVIQARDVAEEGAKTGLQRLAVPNPVPFPNMTAEDRELRNRLRAKARQLGDVLEKRVQNISHLTAECAYEYWHRMLFARFLAENHLLMHSDGVPVTLAECEELAPQEGLPDGWTLASRYAARMLPQIFRPDDPLLQVKFAPEHKHEMERILSALPTEVFTADDSLGWVYQFWQSKKKDEVNKSEKKIGADELPAVTQLFTEDYMVLFLLHNTIGAWWSAKLLSEGRIEKGIWDKCNSENDCRRLVSVNGFQWEYLRFVKDHETSEWRPASGSFAGWPRRVRELTVLDPCCGSGHFLVAAFIILVYLLMEEERISAEEACNVVLKQCLFGLEIDQRCTQIAAFALALAAWKFPDAGGFRPLPQFRIACSGLSVGAKKEDWLALAGFDTRLKAGMDRMYNLFVQAPTLGSLINPLTEANGDLMEAAFEELIPLIKSAAENDQARSDPLMNEVGVAAQGVAAAALLLGCQYHLVATNVPYLKRARQSADLADHLKRCYPQAKADLATTFFERCLLLSSEGCVVALVTPQHWLYTARYVGLRQRMLRGITWNLSALLGVGSFEMISGEIVNVALLVCTRDKPSAQHVMMGVDVSSANTPIDKALCLRTNRLIELLQAKQLDNPDARIVIGKTDKHDILSRYANAWQGIASSDKPRFTRMFWELNRVENGWKFQQGTVATTCLYGGREQILYWEDGYGQMATVCQDGAPFRGQAAWGKLGVAISQMGDLPATLYTGELFDNNTSVLVPHEESHRAALWSFCKSPLYGASVRKIDRGLKVTNATLDQVPFDIEYWQKVAEDSEPIPVPWSNDPTQWLFKGTVAVSTDPFQVAAARLLGYRWPGQEPDSLDEYADDDGVVGIPAIMGEKPAAERLRELLAAAYGKEWSPAKEAELLSSIGYGGSTLDDWLRNGFFEQHCNVFHQRPFIWHIWDGRKDGFSVLVNYHKLNYQLLERLTYTYLNDWIKRQRDSASRGEGGADDRLVRALELQDKLKLILEGEPPYDIFVRWKPIEQQPIGWNPDLNDGVRLNIRPFVEANVLRKRPNINWNKDRGKDVESAPWYKKFKGDRVNDHHVSNQEKIEARRKAGMAK